MWRLGQVLFIVGLVVVITLTVIPAGKGLSVCFSEATERVANLDQARSEGMDNFCKTSQNDLELLDTCIRKQEQSNFMAPLFMKLMIGRNNSLVQIRSKHNQVCSEYQIPEGFPGMN